MPAVAFTFDPHPAALVRPEAAPAPLTTPDRRATLLRSLGVDAVVNRKGTTWRRLDAATQSALTAGNAAALLAREPSLVKRPVFESGTKVSVGFPKTGEAEILARLR